MNIEEQIEFLKTHLRVLDGWKIEYNQTLINKTQCEWDVDKKQATIYRFGRKGRTPKDYILHEMIHIALASIFKGKTKKEMKVEQEFIRALCGLIDYKKIK